MTFLVKPYHQNSSPMQSIQVASSDTPLCYWQKGVKCVISATLLKSTSQAQIETVRKNLREQAEKEVRKSTIPFENWSIRDSSGLFRPEKITLLAIATLRAANKRPLEGISPKPTTLGQKTIPKSQTSPLPIPVLSEIRARSLSTQRSS